MSEIAIQKQPFRVPMNDGKIIDEHFGLATLAVGNLSLARMVAPPGWSEPHQTPEFDEYTLVISGRKQIETENGVIVLAANESVFIPRGNRIRYSNPFDEPCEYVSVCTPPFSIQNVNRED